MSRLTMLRRLWWHRAAKGPAGQRGAAACQWLAGFKLDSAWRDAMGLKIPQGGEAYSEEETALIAKGLSLLDSLAADTGKVRLLRHSKTVESAWTKHDKKSSC